LYMGVYVLYYICTFSLTHHPHPNTSTTRIKKFVFYTETCETIY